jgi:hypothetical protein
MPLVKAVLTHQLRKITTARGRSAIIIGRWLDRTSLLVTLDETDYHALTHRARSRCI